MIQRHSEIKFDKIKLIASAMIMLKTKGNDLLGKSIDY